VSQYVAPPANLSDRDILLLIDQKLFLVIERLYGNGQPGDLRILHDRVTAVKATTDEQLESLRKEQATIRSWQDERSGGSGLARQWIPILLAFGAVLISWFKH
jgi:hypothetical protein